MIDADQMAVDESEAYMSAQVQITDDLKWLVNFAAHSKIQRLIADTPTVDAVPVVRCKDCKYYKSGELLYPNKFCFRLKHPTENRVIGYNFGPDDFAATAREGTGTMQIGDTIRARFMTLPEPFPGMGASIDKQYPVRRATVVYLHPKGRYIVAECKGVRETFFPEDVEA